jgi:hypothetical protein
VNVSDPDELIDRQGMLRGKVHILPWQAERASQLEQDRAVRQMREALLLAPPHPSKAELDELRRQVTDLAIRNSLNRVEIEFALMRTGELRLWYTDDDLPQFDTSEGAGALGNAGALKDLAEQAYFFIKDMVHDHTHHDPSSDQITPLTDMGAHRADPTHIGEVAWRRETAWSLSREIERLNRDGGLVDQRRSLGIIAYAQAFQQALMGHVRDEATTTGFREDSTIYDYDFAHLKESIRAKVDVSATAKAQTVQLALAFAATFLSAMSVVGSLMSARNGSLPRSAGTAAPTGGITLRHGSGLIQFMAWNPFFTAGALAVFLLGVLSFALADGEAGLFNRAQRVFSQMARAASISLVRSSRKQLGLNWLIHILAAFAALAVALLCLAILTGVLDP